MVGGCVLRKIEILIFLGCSDCSVRGPPETSCLTPGPQKLIFSKGCVEPGFEQISQFPQEHIWDVLF